MDRKLMCSLAAPILALPIDDKMFSNGLKSRARRHALDCEACFAVLFDATARAVESGLIQVPPLTPERRRDIMAIPYEDYSWALERGQKWAKRFRACVVEAVKGWHRSSPQDSTRSANAAKVIARPQIDQRGTLWAKLALNGDLVPVLRLRIGEHDLDVAQSDARGIEVRGFACPGDTLVFIHWRAFEVLYKKGGTPPRHVAAQSLAA